MSESIQPLLGPPPPFPDTQQAYMAHSGHGSVGPVIGVVAMITILGAIAVVIGRLCLGHQVMGLVGYDFEGWVESKFASCIDGRIDSPSLPSPPAPPEVMEEPSRSLRGKLEPGREEVTRHGQIDPRENV